MNVHYRLDVVLALVAVALVVAAGKEAPAEQAAAAPAVDSPARWLWAPEKGEAWMGSTEKSRQLLDKLNLESPFVQKHLATVKRKVALLTRTAAFDWRKQTAIDYLEQMLDDLIAGQEPTRRYAGKGFGYPYWSDTMRRVEAIWVHVPPDYDPEKRYQLFMYYKCGGGIHFKDGKAAGGYRPTAEMANGTDTFHMWSSLSTQVKGRMGAKIELEEATAALTKDFSVDPDRVFLTGWSDGGFTAIWLAAHYPHLVAGIAPNCANWQYTNAHVVGLSNLPTLAVDGWFDGGYNRSQFVRWQMLDGLKADASAIWGQHGHSYQPYEDGEEFQYILDWAKAKRRNLHPRRVSYSTWNLTWPRAYWVTIERANEPWLACRIDAEVKDKNLIQVQTWNVAAYRLQLDDKLVSPDKRTVVVTNGQRSYEGPFERELRIELAGPPAGKYVKSDAMPDGIAAQTAERSYGPDQYLAIPGQTFLAVKPTGMDEKTAQLLAGWYPENARADTDITDEDLVEQNLFIYGGPTVNRLAERIAADLPVQFERGRFIVGEKAYDQATHCVTLLHPNPLNPKKYVVLYAFNDATAFARNDFFKMKGESAWAFRVGDCVVRGIPSTRPKWGVSPAVKSFDERHIIFDNAWQVPRTEPLGELIESFDYMQLLRLEADAIREATGTVIGMICGHTPKYLRWSERLAPGPVTLHDLATLDTLPQYVSVAEVNGKDLMALRRFQPAAWTIFADRREPACSPADLALADVDPEKTYRVAFGYHGIPAYGTEPAKMPRLFRFGNESEFLGSERNSMFAANLKLLPLQVTEAVAQYIRKRGKVGPRRIGYDLTDYVMNPEANDFGAYDWLHLGIDTDRLGPPDDEQTERYTINFGFRRSDQPDLGPPQPNSKQFRELDLEHRDPVRLGFVNLAKQLPLNLNLKTSSWAVVANAGYEKFQLAAPNAEGHRVGRAALVDLQFVNQGPTELAGEAVLADSILRKINGEVWPTGARDSTVGYYAGFHRTIGKWKEPPVHEDAVLLLFPDGAAKLDKLVTPNAGYNFGLVGLRLPVTIKAGDTCSLRLLLIAVERPPETKSMMLETVLESLRDSLPARS
ncbi:MAG: prolyl oligopeptidase family serine peptidase [Planctomycetes bacterium]|nr:prolyl oligopeptidase family serine peptidase [Planctomycetota bacterium]